MKITTKELTLCAVLSALALALSYMESFFPLVLLVPLPGVKLGLANIVTLYALYALGFPRRRLDRRQLRFPVWRRRIFSAWTRWTARIARSMTLRLLGKM